MLKIPYSLLTMSVSGVGIPKETQKAHEFIGLVWVHDDLVLWPKLPFIIYNLLEPNSHPALVTLDWNVPAGKWALRHVCHKAMAITCGTVGNKVERHLERLPHAHILLCSSPTRCQLLIG